MGNTHRKGTVLVVTNNETFKQILQGAVLQAGYQIRAVHNQAEGIKELQNIHPVILIVDRRESGFAQLYHVLPCSIPILTVMYHSATCDQGHCALDIEDGAARAVCNATPAIIVALLAAILRRQRWDHPTPNTYAANDVTVDLENHEVRVGASSVHITPTQFRILKSLVAAPGHFLSRKALIDQVWGEGFAIGPHNLDVNLSSLRRTLNSKGIAQDFIVTLKGVGFKLRPSTVSAETFPYQTSRSPIPQEQHPSFRLGQNPTRTASLPRLVGGSCWQHQLAHPSSARYRSKPRAARRSGQNEREPLSLLDMLSQESREGLF